jgi:hypothetical protein
MRACLRAAAVLALLAAPAGVGAQAPPPPIPTCAVLADEAWTPQEKFVWTRICDGDVADLNPGVPTGHIDPWARGLPASRILRAVFIETILTREPYRGAITRHGVRVSGARFTEHIDLQNAVLANELWFEGCLFEKGADLSWLQTTEPIAFNTSKLDGPLSFYAAQIASDLHVSGSHIGKVEMSGVRVGRTLDLSRSHVTDQLGLSGIDVGANLLMSDGEYAKVSLLGAHVAHTLNLEKSRITGKLWMDSLHVDVYLHLQNAMLGEVNLLGARVQNQLSFEGATVTGEVDMFDGQVGTDLWMRNATFLDKVNLRYTQIGGQLDLSGAKFHRDVDLSGARVGGTFQLHAAQWQPNVSLTARFARLAVIPRLSDTWPPKLHIVGLTYDGIQSVEGIESVGDVFDQWLGRQERYARQPYEHLATILQGQGEIETATAVRYAERERDRDEQRRHASWPIFSWLTLLKYLIGYGYYPYYSIWWIVGFVIVGALVLRISGEGRRNAMPIGLTYSFDMLLPIVRLRDQHYAIDLMGWARYYFYGHKLMGWVLASFLVAGLSGLTK